MLGLRSVLDDWDMDEIDFTKLKLIQPLGKLTYTNR